MCNPTAPHLDSSEQPLPTLPELLCPVGSPLALDAAIEGGADALYLGGSMFNARMNAANFDANQLQDAVRRAHAYGVKVYLTMNTLLYDREQTEYLRAAEQAAACGVDALIVADLGGAVDIHRAFPTLPLHASTQMSVHSAAAGDLLAALGFCRMVVARELSYLDLCHVVKHSPIEIEAFVHGALCVCHSGQCLFSSLVGGRSGNRGECAQPCRLPYRSATGSKESYPLSLKDLSLAAHIPELLQSGVASLKIEGRMKPPAYVYHVTKIWRTLLDQRRSATPDEMRELSEIFSRGGFTDGYWTRHLNHKMLGVRSAENKAQSEKLSAFTGKITRTVPLDWNVRIKQGEPIQIDAAIPLRKIHLTGPTPEPAITAPATEELVIRQLSKLGGTPFALRQVRVDLDPGLMLPVSLINQLRRDAVAALTEQQTIHAPAAHSDQAAALSDALPSANVDYRKTARFTRAVQLTDDALAYFDCCYLPLHVLIDEPTVLRRASQSGTTIGVLLPEVITDHERPAVESMLDRAVAMGISRAMVGNLGHLDLILARSLCPDGDFRLNVTNSHSATVLQHMGFQTLIASPEMTLPQIRDLRGAAQTIVYGRIPLMILEKCVTQELYPCQTCRDGGAVLVDRRGVPFPLGRAPEHRTLIYNSMPTYMADRADLLTKYRIGAQHFLFTTESPMEVDRVLHAYRHNLPADGPIRRIGV